MLASGIVIAVTAGALLVLGVSAAKIELLTAVSVYGLGWLAAIATVRAVRDLDRSEGLSFDSYWGGLGGAQGGWRVSPTMVSLVLALVLIAGTVAVATGKGPTVTTNKQDAATANSADEEETASNNASADNGQ